MAVNVNELTHPDPRRQTREKIRIKTALITARAGDHPADHLAALVSAGLIVTSLDEIDAQPSLIKLYAIEMVTDDYIITNDIYGGSLGANSITTIELEDGTIAQVDIGVDAIGADQVKAAEAAAILTKLGGYSSSDATTALALKANASDMTTALAAKAAAIVEETVLVDGATVTWDLTAAPFATVTLGGDRTLALANLTPGTYVLNIKQDSTGTRIFTWPSTFKWPADTPIALTTTADLIDVLTIRVRGNGDCLVSLEKGFAETPPPPAELGGVPSYLTFPASGFIDTIAGLGGNTPSGDDGLASAADIGSIRGVGVAGNGDIYIVNGSNSSLRKIDGATGIITTVIPAYTLSNPNGLAVANNGDAYVVSTNGHCVYKYDASEDTYAIFAGGNGNGSAGDGGQATSAQLSVPEGVGIGPDGKVYISDTNNNKIRVVDTDGIITTFAGTGTGSWSGDGGQATSATIKKPKGVAVAADGIVYISDNNNGRIRKVAPDGVITTYGGQAGGGGYTGDGGPATSADIAGPRGMTVAPNGDLWISFQYNYAVRVIFKATGNIDTVIGGNGSGFGGDEGAVLDATLGQGWDIALDSDGNAYFADGANRRLRVAAA